MNKPNQLIFPNDLSSKELQERIANTDAAFAASLLRLANVLCAEKELFLIGVTGPTCSGKTTAAKMLTDHFLKNGRTLHVISVDDFYYEKAYLYALSRESGKTGLDYDSEKTIDTALLQTCLLSLFSGKETVLPKFNFHTGLRERGVSIAPQKTDLFLLEGIQILYPGVYSILRDIAYQSVAICPQSSITVGGSTFLPNEIRLMRRLVRDEIHRGSSASFTFSLWKGVRENEEKNIFPYLKKCDFTVDSTISYEIGVLKPFLLDLLAKMREDDPFFEIAKEILTSVQNVQTVNSGMISPNSLYREFI